MLVEFIGMKSKKFSKVQRKQKEKEFEITDRKLSKFQKHMRGVNYTKDTGRKQSQYQSAGIEGKFKLTGK